MENLPYPFKSKKGETAFMAAYDAMLQYWPVPYESFDIPGAYGCTHLVASGPKDAPAVVLLHGGRASLTMWSANVGDLSREYRVYAVDIIGQPGKSIAGTTFKKRADLVPLVYRAAGCSQDTGSQSGGPVLWGLVRPELCPPYAGKGEQARPRLSSRLFPPLEPAAYAERGADVLLPHPPGNEKLQAVGDLPREHQGSR